MAAQQRTSLGDDADVEQSPRGALEQVERVVGLDVAVHEAGVVQARQQLAELVHHLHHRRGVALALGRPVGERDAALEDDEGREDKARAAAGAAVAVVGAEADGG